MILLLGGTGDSRDLAVFLIAGGQEIMLTTVTGYGAQLAEQTGVHLVLSGALSPAQLRALISKHQIKAIVDATHPYAEAISHNAIAIAGECSLSYCRYERQNTAIEEEPLLYRVNSLEEAAKKASELGDNILLTIGSKGLEKFLQSPDIQGKRVIARVLPDREVIGKCLELGLTAKEIIAMQGPFSRELNQAIYRQTATTVVVTKDGGTTGGTDTKLNAAIEMGIPVVLILRPKLDYPHKCTTFQEVLDFLTKGEKR
ncbi:MAG: precorrin-6A reductase [Carboxydocellales bacterium]